MKHDIGYYRAIHGTNGVQNAKEAKVRAYQRETQRAFHKALNWEIVMVKRAIPVEYLHQIFLEQEFQIIPTNDPLVKKIKSRPEEHISLGDIIHWRGTYWLVNMLDAGELICNAAQMIQCNACLRWLLEDGTIYEEYGWDKDGSKYSFGEDHNRYMDTADFVMKVVVQVNAETLKIRRNKRFLLGQYGVGCDPMATEVSRINGVTNTYMYDENNKHYQSGLLEITLHETQFKEGIDNPELGIADYYTPESFPTDDPSLEGDAKGKGWFDA